MRLQLQFAVLKYTPESDHGHECYIDDTLKIIEDLILVFLIDRKKHLFVAQSCCMSWGLPKFSLRNNEESKALNGRRLLGNTFSPDTVMKVGQTAVLAC